MATAPRTTRKGTVTTISFTGPFFEKDPGLTLRENMRVMVAAMAEEGATDMQAQIRAKAGSMPYSTGWTADHVYGHTKSSKTGRPWALWAAVSQDTQGMDAKTAIRTMAAASSIGLRWDPWRKTRNRLTRSRKVNKAELLKGIA